MANRRELVVAIVSDASQFSRGFDKAKRDVDGFSKGVDKASSQGLGRMDTRVNAVSASVKNFALTAAAAFGTHQVVSFARDAIGEFSNLNESVNAVNVTFGDSADGIKALGENAATSVGLANSEFNTLAVGFSAFVDQIAGDGGDVVEVMDDLTTRVADFASVMNLDVPDAAEKFRSGLAGETEPLRKFGIDVSAAATTAKALELGLADSSAALSEQDKILARYHLIMEQTEKTAGDFANTSDDLANKQRILSAEWKDAQARIGEGLAPIMESLLDVAEKLIPVVESLGSSIADQAQDVLVLIGPLLDLVGLLADLNDLGDGGGPGPLRFLSASARNALDVINPIRVVGEVFGDTGDAADDASDAFIANAAAADRAKHAVLGLKPAAKDAGEAIGTSGEKARIAAERISAAADEIRDLSKAFLEAADPAFAAAEAVRKYEKALGTRAAVEGNAASTAEDLARANLNVAEAALEAQGALNSLDEGGVVGAIATLATALDVPFATAQGILETLGLIDGLEVTAVVNVRQAGHVSVGGITGGITERAGGGPLGRGQASIVGERGPELFVPESAGRIIPNNQLGANSYSLNVNVAGDVTGPALDDIQRELILAGVGRWAEVD